MMKPTHQAGGVTLWEITVALAVALLPIPLTIVPLIIIVGAPIARWSSLWPDWDHDRATMVYRYGRRSLDLRWTRRKGAYVATVRRPGKIAQRFARYLKRRFGGHRGGTHSFLAGVPLCGAVAGVPAVVIGIALVALTGISLGTGAVLVGTVILAAIVGGASHTLLDGLTCNCWVCDPDPRTSGKIEYAGPHVDRHGTSLPGCQMFWPVIKRRFGIPLLAVESPTEKKRVLPFLQAAQYGGAVLLVAVCVIRFWQEAGTTAGPILGGP
jgi:LexA-binding, inner membrane-associated putative hydrolase